MTKQKEVLILTVPQTEMVLSAVAGCVHDGKQTYDKYEVLRLLKLIESKLTSVGITNSQTGYSFTEASKGGDENEHTEED